MLTQMLTLNSTYADSDDDDGERVSDVAVVSKRSKHIHDGSLLTVHSSSVLTCLYNTHLQLCDSLVTTM